jgi:hypothetical protein
MVRSHRSAGVLGADRHRQPKQKHKTQKHKNTKHKKLKQKQKRDMVGYGQ